MILYFYNRELEELVNKLFDIAPRIYSKLSSVKIKGDSDEIPLPFYSFATMEKSIQFITEIINRNQQIKLFFEVSDNRFELLIKQSEYIAFYFDREIVSEEILYLYPLYYKLEETYYYSPNYCLENSNKYVKKSNLLEISEQTLKNYQYSNFVNIFSKKIHLRKINQMEYIYHYKTFLPESINTEGLIRLLFLCLGRKEHQYSEFLILRASDQIEIDRSKLRDEKKLFFIIKKLNVRGEFIVKEKRFKFQKLN
jgi:hypothetical protein